MFSFPLLCFFLSAWSLPVGPTRRGWPRIEVAAHDMAAGGGGRPHGRMHAVGLPANLASTTCIRISHARRLGTEARELASPTRRGWAQRPSLATPRAAAARPQPLAPQPPARVTARRGHLLVSGSSPSPHRPQQAAHAPPLSAHHQVRAPLLRARSSHEGRPRQLLFRGEVSPNLMSIFRSGMILPHGRL